MRALRIQDRGITVVELSLTTLLLTMVLASFYAAFNGFLRDVGFQTRQAEAQQQTRPVLRDLVTRLRQAEPPDTSASEGQPVGYLRWDTMRFYTDLSPLDGKPEQVTYEAINCDAEDSCELQFTIRVPTNDGPDFTYPVAPTSQRILLPRIHASDAGEQLFSAAQYIGEPSVRTDVTECDREGELVDVPDGPCEFQLVVVDLRVDPSSLPNPRVFEVHEEVRIRNAGF